MPFPWAEAITAVGSIASSLLSHKSGEDSSAIQYATQTKLNKQNYKYNVKLINKQNAFNEAMMDKANAFNERIWNQSVDLSNTAHQREVADLRAAGLNPVLSANGGATTVNPIQSAQTSSGNSQLSSSAGMPDVDYLSAMDTALGMYNSTRAMNSQLKNDQTNRDSIEGHLNIDRNNSASQIAVNDKKIDEMNANINAVNQKVKNETKVANATAYNLQKQGELAASNSARNNADINRINKEAEYTNTKNKYHTVTKGLQLGKLGTFGVVTTPNMPTLKIDKYNSVETINGHKVNVTNYRRRKK